MPPAVTRGRVATLAGDMQELGRIVRDLDRRLVKLETKLEVHERLREKPRGGRRLRADE